MMLGFAVLTSSDDKNQQASILLEAAKEGGHLAHGEGQHHRQRQYWEGAQKRREGSP